MCSYTVAAWGYGSGYGYTYHNKCLYADRIYLSKKAPREKICVLLAQDYIAG